MKNIEIKVYKNLCSTETFLINKKRASSDDFGVQEDTDYDNRCEYGCGNMEFSSYPIDSEQANEAMQKYNITESEYEYICNILEKELSFGKCSACV